MGYDNAEPKVLKFLVSDGKLVDESGNVIAESDTLRDLYIKSSPQVKKYLLSDGSVVDENNNLIIKNDYFKKVYDQATPRVQKYLHANGTVDGNAGVGVTKLITWVEVNEDIEVYTTKEKEDLKVGDLVLLIANENLHLRPWISTGKVKEILTNIPSYEIGIKIDNEEKVYPNLIFYYGKIAGYNDIDLV